MKKFFLVLSIIFLLFSIFACKKKAEMPYGAETEAYDKVEGINKNGPAIEKNENVNTPPTAPYSYVENGPVIGETDPEIFAPPMADINPLADNGGIPIIKKAD